MTGPTPALTYGLRELVWGIESELAVVANLSHLIDQHVLALNSARAELARRLGELDELLTVDGDGDGDGDLQAFLRARTAVVLPSTQEDVPARLQAEQASR